MIKFLHAADLHLDAPFSALSPEQAAARRQEQRALLEDAITRALVTCYAVEGRYPSSLSYLEENYGVQVNHSRFIVSYEAYASNQLPAVAVLEKQTA